MGTLRAEAAILLLLAGAARAQQGPAPVPDDKIASVSSAFFDGNGARMPLGDRLAMPAPPPAPDKDQSHMLVRFFDGARKPLNGAPVFLRVWDGNQKERMARFMRGPEIMVAGLPFYDNFGDNYRVVAFANGRVDAGYHPVKLQKGKVEVLDLMLPAKNATFDFSRASWEAISADPHYGRVVKAGPRGTDPAERWRKLLSEKPAAAAGLLNILAACKNLAIGGHNPLSYFEYILFDDKLQQDRVWVHAEMMLLDAMKADKRFKKVKGEDFFHPGAIESFKQVEFQHGNLQFTFHPEQREIIAGHEHVLVEIDIDLHKDLVAHTLFEVLPNGFRHGKTDPRKVLQLRWMEGRRKGAPEFDPLYDLK